MTPVITDNFLDHYPFQHLQNVMFGDDFNWFYSDGIDIEEEESGGKGDKFQFFHSFYNPDVGVNSYQFEELNSILNKIQPKEIFKIKANLLTRTSEIVKNTFHVDIEDFYNNNECNQFFDEINYAKLYPESREFYQPYCKFIWILG